MHLTQEDIQNTPKIKRLNIINSISGIKPANLIGTQSADGLKNLAIFSSVVHLGSNPALLGFIVRPQGEVPRNTYENILETGYYTINHVHESFIEKAHYTSAKFEREISEFDECGLTPNYLDDFRAPYVKESVLKMGMKHVQSIPIELNGTILVIGEIKHLYLPDDAVTTEGYVDLDAIKTAGIGGLNTYYALNKMDQFPFARLDELPNFKK